MWPKITSHDVILQRVVLRVPQMAEQLVDVPVPEKVLQVSRGATSLRGEGTATGGCRALATSSGPPPVGLHRQPRGGVQIRGNAAMVADVLVIMHDKFQQSLPIDSEVPQFQFFDRVLDIPVVPQWTGDSAEICGGSAVAVLVGVVQFLDKVVACARWCNDVVAQCVVRQ